MDLKSRKLKIKSILLFLVDNEKKSRKEAVSLLKIGDTKAKELFNVLLEKKLIERKGQGRSAFYSIQFIN